MCMNTCNTTQHTYRHMYKFISLCICTYIEISKYLIHLARLCMRVQTYVHVCMYVYTCNIYIYIYVCEATAASNLQSLSHSSKRDLRSAEVVFPVMCADAATRGVPCKPSGQWVLLPAVPDPSLADYYVHINEIMDKITKDLKAAGCWKANPLPAQGQGVEVSAPGLGVEVSNTHLLETSWHRWSPANAPLPLGTSTKWKELLKTHEFTFTDDLHILWDPESWCWGATPTWYISGVSSQRTAQALLVELLIQHQPPLQANATAQAPARSNRNDKRAHTQTRQAQGATASRH